jgi:segregation and condensation protein B
MENNELKNILVSVLLSASEPLTVERIAQVFDEEVRPDNKTLKEALGELIESSFADLLDIKEVASGYRAQIKADYAPYIIKLWEEKPSKYSRAFLETLVLIAYRQPITRAEIEEVRGVAVNPNILKTFFEREWIRVIGHKELPGKPELLATTKKFLDYFNLKSLDELPTLDEIHNLDQAAATLEQQLELDIQSVADSSVEENSIDTTVVADVVSKEDVTEVLSEAIEVASEEEAQEELLIAADIANEEALKEELRIAITESIEESNREEFATTES